ncbi:hypothetical protein GQX74_004767 [Glossina fuscipes]|nr:hypothetical protein GQX74_004767 [Glossina fuscipes]
MKPPKQKIKKYEKYLNVMDPNVHCMYYFLCLTLLAQLIITTTNNTTTNTTTNNTINTTARRRWQMSFLNVEQFQNNASGRYTFNVIIIHNSVNFLLSFSINLYDWLEVVVADV